MPEPNLDDALAATRSRARGRGRARPVPQPEPDQIELDTLGRREEERNMQRAASMASAVASSKDSATLALQQAKANVQRDVRTVVDPREIKEIDRRVAELQMNRRENQPAPFIPRGALARPLPGGPTMPNPESRVWRRDERVEDEMITRQLDPKTNEFPSKQGHEGEGVMCLTNFVRTEKTSNWTMFQYHVQLIPEPPSVQVKKAVLATHNELIGDQYLFDGMMLHTVAKIPIPDDEKRLELEGTHPRTGEKIYIIIRKTGELPPNHPQAVHILNTCNNQTFDFLGYHQLGRHYFDPQRAALIEKHGVEVWPGMISSIRVFDAGFLMTLDVAHRVLRKDTVLDYMMMLYNRCSRPGGDGSEFYRKAAQDLIGMSVLTRYNNKTYRIDDIIWDMKVTNTFQKADGTTMTYKQYYQDQYNLRIEDDEQPLLLSKAKRKGIKIGGPKKGKKHDGDVPKDIYLVPELCAMTGLSETMRADRVVMQDLAEYTRASPQKRLESSKQFLQQVRTNASVDALYKTWGIRPADDVLEVRARKLPREPILVSGDKEIQVDYVKVEWTNGLKRSKLADPVDLKRWGFLFLDRDESAAKEAFNMMCQLAPGLGMTVAEPEIFVVQDDRVSSFTGTCESAYKQIPGLQILVVIVPNDKKDRYDAIKKLTCLDFPIPTQIINSKTLGKQKQLQSILAKIQMQIVCKLGGSLWKVKIPFKSAKVMIIGYDSYHDSAHRGRSVGAAVFSLDQDFTKWYAQCEEHGESRELVNNLADFTRNGLKKYFDLNGCLPDRIFFYRDGVGDGQVPIVFHHEIPQLKNCFEQIVEGREYDPKLTFTIVTKRTNVRFFKKISATNAVNPDPGTIVDVDITRPERYDYYMVPQSVNQGTVTPVAYNVIYDESGLKPDHLQRLSYKLCHLYYNWQGTIRVPAPCQFAHKLAFLIGQSVHRRPDEKLMDKLFFL